jgi:two-component system phosphate regulon response regulator PhoB
MSKGKILIIDDEQDIRQLLKYNLEREGYQTIPADTGEKASEITKTELPALIVLDLMLPGIDGLDVCRKLKNDPATENIPIVMLTAKDEESDIVTGLELGADDYITKPFSPKVLIARIKKILQRSRPAEDKKDKNVIRIQQLTIDKNRHEVRIAGEPVKLTFTEFNILFSLARRAGMVFTRYQIVDSVHGTDYPVTDRAVDVQIVSLRKKLSKYGKLIETVRGIGYRFRDDKDV